MGGFEDGGGNAIEEWAVDGVADFFDRLQEVAGAVGVMNLHQLPSSTLEQLIEVHDCGFLGVEEHEHL